MQISIKYVIEYNLFGIIKYELTSRILLDYFSGWSYEPL